MPEYRDWRVSQEGGVARVMLDRPQVQNHLVTETLYELRQICAHLGTSADVRVVVVQGQGSHFCSGMDPHEIAAWVEQPEEAIRQLLSSQQACLDALERLEKPTIAQIHGFCIGGGLLLALCCDFRITSQRSVFSLPEIRLGLPVLWGTQRIVRIVGEAAARELVLLGKRVRANEALALGLVNQVVAVNELDAAVKGLAGKLARLPMRSVGVAKRIIQRSQEFDGQDVEALERQAVAELKDDPEVRQAVEAYTRKLPPNSSGGR